MENQFVGMGSPIRAEGAFIKTVCMNIHMNDQLSRVTERGVTIFPSAHLFFRFVSLIATTVEHSFVLLQNVVTVTNELTAFNQTRTDIRPAMF